MNIYKINTTAYEEEDFFLMTSLTIEDIVEVINPIVMAERDGYEDYDNHMLVEALEKRYPKAKVFMYNDFETITI
jgi:hypothetical protein